MKRYKLIFVLFIALSFLELPLGVCGSKKTPWHLRHFPNVPRITAEQAMEIKLSGQKVVLIDAPWGKDDFDKGHICGAIPTKWEADKLDKLIKKIPKDYILEFSKKSF